MKEVTREQVMRFLSRVIDEIRWDDMDSILFHYQVLNVPPGEFGSRLTDFLKIGMRMNMGEMVVATAPFDETFCEGFFIDPKEQDSVAAAMTKVDFKDVVFIPWPIRTGRGEDFLDRIRQFKGTLYGANLFMGLWLEFKRHGKDSILEQIYKERKVEQLYFFGDIVKSSSSGQRSVLSLKRGYHEWTRHYCWLGHGPGDNSAVLFSPLNTK